MNNNLETKLKYNALYTNQKNKKNKTWKDGMIFNNRICRSKQNKQFSRFVNLRLVYLMRTITFWKSLLMLY